MTERADGQVTWSDLGLWSGKTCPERSAATKGKTSRQSSKRSYASQNRKPLILKCLKKAGTPGGATTMKWEDDGAWLGECMTRNTGESPNVAVVSRLSQILEETPQEKYCLSAKACQGILRRAERRGKDLLEQLKAVLIQQSQGASPQERTEAPALTEAPTSYAVRDMLVVSSEISPTLRAKANDPYREDMAAYIASVDCRNFCEGGEINGTLQAKESSGQSLNLQNTVRTGMIVRRLTPLECERLQGYPDGWTNIGEWRDSKGKLRKPSDSPRYKACGNSIALPFWDFLAKRISAQYLRPVTMGSLFDGIGGFPLVFERHNGKGTARWASEIEEFPIAVTKLRFGEE